MPPPGAATGSLVSAAAARGVEMEWKAGGPLTLMLPPSRAPQVLPNMQRCGMCETCTHLKAKRACLRNQVGVTGGRGLYYLIVWRLGQLVAAYLAGILLAGGATPQRFRVVLAQ